MAGWMDGAGENGRRARAGLGAPCPRVTLIRRLAHFRTTSPAPDAPPTAPRALTPFPRRREGLACAVCLDQTLRVFIVTKLNKL